MGAMKQLYTELQEAGARRCYPLTERDRRLHQAAFAMYIELELQKARWVLAGGDEEAIASIDKVLARVE